MANRVDVMKPVLAILLFILAAGCSGVSTVPDAAPVNGRSADAAVSRQLWGLYDVAVDIRAATIEAVPLRQADLRVNVLVFLEPPPLSYLKIDFSDLEIIPPVGGADGLINVDVLITHPFLGQTFFTGFDVKGIVFGPRLDNADGTTRWWNPVEFTGAGMFGFQPGLLGYADTSGFTRLVNDFKYFAFGLGESESLDDEIVIGKIIAGRGHFPAGQTLSRHYEINFGPDAADFFKFQYAVDASWVAPTGEPPYGPEAFPPYANQAEAWNVTVAVIENTLNYYNGTGEGNLTLHVAVYDWQGCDDTIVTLSPDEPGVFEPVTALTPISDFGDYAIFEIEETEAAPTHPGELPLTLEVESIDVTYKYGDPPPSPNPDENVISYEYLSVEVDNYAPGECQGTLHAKGGWDTNLWLDSGGVDSMWDMAFIKTGTFAGMALYPFRTSSSGPITQINYFDADNPIDYPPRGTFHTFPAEDKPEWVWSIDCDHVMGRVLWIGDDKADTFRIVSDGGTKLGELEVQAVSNVIAIQAACFDDMGNLWVLSLRTTAFEPDYELRRYQPVSSDPYYVQDQFLDLSPYHPFSLLSFIYDMAYNGQADRLYIFDMHGSFDDLGSVDVFDVATDGTPTENTGISKEDIFTKEVDVLPAGPDGRHDWYFHVAWGGDIVIDHSAGTNERCRIVCMAVLDDDGADEDTDAYWVLFDEDLNIVDEYNEPFSEAQGGKCWDTFAINPDDNRNIAAMWRADTWEYSAKPPDW